MADGLHDASRKDSGEGRRESAGEGIEAGDRRVASERETPVRSRDDDQARGAVLFAKEWVSNDPMSHGGDGLGPVYNETSCVACHGLGAPGGAGPETKNVVLVTSIANGCSPPQGLDPIFPSLGGAAHRSPASLFDRSRL